MNTAQKSYQEIYLFPKGIQTIGGSRACSNAKQSKTNHNLAPNEKFNAGDKSNITNC